MTEVTLAEAQATLPALIAGLPAGGTVVITAHDKPVATLAPPVGGRPQPVYGRGKGKVVYFDPTDDNGGEFGEVVS